MAKATLTHTRARRARHPSASSVSAASADPVLTLAKVIIDKEHEERRASRNGDKSLSWQLDAELSQHDAELQLAIPTTWAGAAFKLRKSVHFAESDPIGELVREIADRVSRGRIELRDLSRLRSAAVHFSRQENDASAAFITTALRWLARPKLV